MINRQNPMKTWYGAVIIGYKINPLRILIIENPERKKLTFISGAVEGDETVRDAAVRELQEEVHWDIQNTDLEDTGIFHTFTYALDKPGRGGDQGSNSIFLLNADKLPEPMETTEAINFHWLSVADALASISFPDLRDVAAVALRTLSQHYD